MDINEVDIQEKSPQQLLDMLDNPDAAEVADEPVEAETEAKVVAEAEKEPEKKAEPKVEPVAEEKEPEGVYLKDNKNIAPWSVVTDLRENKAELKAEVISITESKDKEIADLQKQIATAKAEGDTQEAKALEQEKVAVKTNYDDQLGKIKEEFGDEQAGMFQPIFENMKALEAQNKQLSESLDEVSQRTLKQSELTQQEEIAKNQAAIDENPVMIQWQSRKDQTYHEYAKETHESLRNKPFYAKLTPKEKYNKLAEVVQSMYGKDELLKTEEVKPKKEPVLEAKKEDEEIVPAALEDFNGGASPNSNSEEEVMNMGGGALTEMMQKAIKAGNEDELIDKLLHHG